MCETQTPVVVAISFLTVLHDKELKMFMCLIFTNMTALPHINVDITLTWCQFDQELATMKGKVKTQNLCLENIIDFRMKYAKSFRIICGFSELFLQ